MRTVNKLHLGWHPDLPDVRDLHLHSESVTSLLAKSAPARRVGAAKKPVSSVDLRE